MPKTRGSNTIANNGSSGGGSRRSSDDPMRLSSTSGSGSGDIGGGGGAGAGAGGIETTEMADRLEDRIAAVRTIVVDVESRTRGGIEQVSVTFDPDNSGHASASSESGNVYDVNHEEGTCTCRHHVHRQARCRHIEATEIARGQLTEGERRANGSLGQGEMENQEAVALRQNIDDVEEEERRAMSGEEQDDNYFYSDHTEEFESNLQTLKNQPIPYDYNNALNGSGATFGIELEFVDGDSNAIARELYEAGICSYPQMLPYRSNDYGRYNTPAGMWKLERDGSVSDGQWGGEIISPVLTDTPENWKTIEKVCEIAKRHGAHVNDQTGAHVHVGMEQLDTARQRWRRFFKSMAGNEESMYKFAGGEMGQYRHNSHDYSPPFEPNARRGAAMRRPIETADDVNRMARDVSEGNRYQGVNLTNIHNSGKPNTVEFRYFNGSLSPGQIQANVKVAVGIMGTAEKARANDSEDFVVTENQKRRSTFINNTDNTRDNESMLKFVDTFFTRKKDKDHVLGVLAKNKWKR